MESITKFKMAQKSVAPEKNLLNASADIAIPMLNESLLWVRAIDPITGRIEKQDTFLCAALKIFLGAVIAIALYAVIFYAFSLL